MPRTETGIKILHEARFFIALFLAGAHVRIQVMDHPMLGYRHVGGVGLAVDQHHPVFAIQAVSIAIVDEARQEKRRLRRANRLGAQ